MPVPNKAALGTHDLAGAILIRNPPTRSARPSCNAVWCRFGRRVLRGRSRALTGDLLLSIARSRVVIWEGAT